MLQSPIMAPRQRGIIAGAALCIAPLIYFLPATLGQVVLCPDDGLLINVPMRATAARMISEGTFPLWDPYIFGGMPLLGASQAGVLFPPNWVFLIFSPQTAMNIDVILAYIVAGLGAYFYARRVGAIILGAFLTGFVWQFCGFMIGPLAHLGSIQTAGLLPWVLWAIDGYGMTAKRSYGVLIAVLVALQFFSGHPQTFVYSSFLAGAYAVVMAARKGGGRPSYQYSLIMMIVGVALATVQLFPTIELVRRSYRQQIDYEFFSGFSMPPSFLLNFFAPFVSGGSDGRFFQLPYTNLNYYAEYIGYVGVITLMLALAALLIKRDRVTIFWWVVAVVCLILAIGRFLPFGINELVYNIPGLNLFRASARHLMEVDLALAVLAGRGLTYIAELKGTNKKRIIFVGIGGFITTCAVVCAYSIAPGEGASVSNALRAPEIWCPMVVAAAGAIALWMLAKGFRNASVIVVVVVIIDLSLWGQFSGWRSGPQWDHALFSQSPLITFLKQKDGKEGPFRILTLFPPADSAVLTALQPDTYMFHGIQNAAGYDAFSLQPYSGLVGGMKEWGELIEPEKQLGDDRALDLLNVRYLVAKQTPDGKLHSGENVLDERTLAPRWRRAASFDDIAVYENTRLQPRAWLATKAVVANDYDMLATIRTGRISDGTVWDVNQTVLVDTPVGALSSDATSQGSAKVTTYSPNGIHLTTDSTANSVLVLSENVYPGWRVTVDGQEQPSLRVNYYQRGVALSAGEHEVEFYYRPRKFLAGLAVSIVALFTLMVWWALGRRTNLGSQPS